MPQVPLTQGLPRQLLGTAESSDGRDKWTECTRTTTATAVATMEGDGEPERKG